MEFKKVEIIAESIMVVVRSWGWGNGEILVKGYKVAVMQDE